MKQIPFLIVAILMHFSAISTMAITDDSIIVELTLNLTEQDPLVSIDDPKELHRTGPRIVFCTMGHDDIYLSNIDVAEILSFEIYNDNGDCLAIFSDKESFLNYLFTTRGYFEIRLLSAQYTLSGWIEICQ